MHFLAFTGKIFEKEIYAMFYKQTSEIGTDYMKNNFKNVLHRGMIASALLVTLCLFFCPAAGAQTRDKPASAQAASAASGTQPQSMPTSVQTPGKQILGMPAKEMQRMMLRCIIDCQEWDYQSVIDRPVWNGGKRWDCSAFIHYFYNEYLLPRAARLNNVRYAHITDENGKELKKWAFYRYQAKNGSVLVNNTKTILSSVGVFWEDTRVKKLVEAWEQYQKDTDLPGSSLELNESLLPEVGDILLYGNMSKKGDKQVRHVGIYLGECRGRGNGYYMAECTVGIVRRFQVVTRSECIGNWRGAAINPFWVSSPIKQQTLLWVKHFVD